MPWIFPAHSPENGAHRKSRWLAHRILDAPPIVVWPSMKKEIQLVTKNNSRTT
jgi:hypothetical protein